MSIRRNTDLWEEYKKLESQIFSAVAWIPENHTRRKVHCRLNRMFDIVEILYSRTIAEAKKPINRKIKKT